MLGDAAARRAGRSRRGARLVRRQAGEQHGQLDVVGHRRFAIRLKDWNTKPISVRRTCARFASLSRRPAGRRARTRPRSAGPARRPGTAASTCHTRTARHGDELAVFDLGVDPAQRLPRRPRTSPREAARDDHGLHRSTPHPLLAEVQPLQVGLEVQRRALDQQRGGVVAVRIDVIQLPQRLQIGSALPVGQLERVRDPGPPWRARAS